MKVFQLPVLYFPICSRDSDEAGSNNVENLPRISGGRNDVRVSGYPQNLALTWPKSGGPLVGIVRSRTKAMEL
jgi:hypothetical protein